MDSWKGYKLDELNHDEYVALEREFRDGIREWANDVIKDMINKYTRFVPELKNLSITEHEKIMQTIKKIGSRIYKALDDVDEYMPLWFDHYMKEEENENGVAYEYDVKFMVVVFFKNNYFDFVDNVFFIFEWLLRGYNEHSPPKEKEGSYKPDLDELLDDYVNIYTDKLCEKFVKEYEIDFGC